MRYLIPLLTAFCLLVGCGHDDDMHVLGEVGAACDSAEECAGGICLEVLGSEAADPITFVDGYCTGECEYGDFNGDGYTDYDEFEGCTEDGLCLNYDPNPWDEEDSLESYCFLAGCLTDWDCRDPNYICMEFGFPPFTPSSTACVPIDVIAPEEDETKSTSFPADTALIYHPVLQQ